MYTVLTNRNLEPPFDLPVSMIRCVADSRRTILFANETSRLLLNLTASPSNTETPKYYADYIHPDDREAVLRAVQKGVTDGEPYEIEYRLLRGVDNRLWVYESGMPRNEKDCVPRFVDAMVLEIDERKQAVEALTRKEEKSRFLADQMEAIFDHLPALVFFKDHENRFIRVNKFVANAYRKTKRELEGVSLYDLYPEDEARAYHADDLAVINSGKEKLNIEEPWETEDGLRWVSTSKIPFVDDTGEVRGVIGISTDITERKRTDNLIKELVHRLELERDQARKNALIDGLTGIANRKGFDRTLEREYLRLQRSGTSISLIMIDIDYFKRYNDRYGHVAGDECLRRVAQALQDLIVRSPDYIARFGGEEFVVLLPDTQERGAMVVAERLRKAVEALAIPHEGSEISPYVTISLGIACTRPRRGESSEQVLKQADVALYNAKDGGRNKVGLPNMSQCSIHKESYGQESFIKLVWNQAFISGNQTIDEQHLELFDIANELLADIVDKEDEAKLLSDIKSLIDALRAHFNDEEAILGATGYPSVEDHRRCHAELLSQAVELSTLFQEKNISKKELLDFIAFAVVSEHMLTEDIKFYPYLTERSD